MPEEVLTVPGAYIAGTKVGGAKQAYQMEAGFAYNEMIEKGVSKETAKTIAKIIGVAMLGVQTGTQIDKGESAYTKDEVKQRLENTLMDSALSFGVIGTPAVGRKISGITKNKNPTREGGVKYSVQEKILT